jgi:hypothetical protein
MTKITHLHPKHPLYAAGDKLLVEMDGRAPQTRFTEARKKKAED